MFTAEFIGGEAIFSRVITLKLSIKIAMRCEELCTIKQLETLENLQS